MTEKEIKKYLFKLLTQLKNNFLNSDDFLFQYSLTHKELLQKNFVIYNKQNNKYFLEEEYIDYVYDKFIKHYGKTLSSESIFNMFKYFHILKPYFNNIEFVLFEESLNGLYDDFVLNCYGFGKVKKLKNNINSFNISTIEINNKKHSFNNNDEKRKIILGYIEKNLKPINSYNNFHLLSKDFANLLFNIKTTNL